MLDKLKSMFIVTEEDDDSKNKENGKVSKTESVKTENPIPKSDVKGTMNSKIMEKLLKVIADNNLEGFDYIEFKNAIKSLDKLPLDEKTKFRSAFATAETIGATVPKILESIEFYQKILAKEESEFTKAINGQLSAKVGDKQQEVEKFSKMIVDKKAQIKKLTEEIDRHQKHINDVKSEITHNTLRIEQTRKDFETTYYKLKYQINEDVKKIKEYLQ